MNVEIIWTVKERKFREGNFMVGGYRWLFEMELHSVRVGRKTNRIWFWSIKTEGGTEVASSTFAEAPVKSAQAVVNRFARRRAA